MMINLYWIALRKLTELLSNALNSLFQMSTVRLPDFVVPAGRADDYLIYVIYHLLKLKYPLSFGVKTQRQDDL